MVPAQADGALDQASASNCNDMEKVEILSTQQLERASVTATQVHARS